MTYIIQHIKLVNGIETDIVNSFFQTEKECRSYWKEKLRDTFVKDCCENGRFMGSNFHEMSTEWTMFFSYRKPENSYSFQLMTMEEYLLKSMKYKR